VVDGRPLTRSHMYTVVSEVRGLSGTGNRTQTRKGRRTKGTQDKRHIIIHIIIFCFLCIYSLERVCRLLALVTSHFVL